MAKKKTQQRSGISAGFPRLFHSAQERGNSDRAKFEQQLWQAADKLRGHMDAGEYKHVVLGLIFLKYISDAFGELYDRLSQEEYAEPEDRDEYLAENIFWVPKEARWAWLQSNAKKPEIGKLIDEGMGVNEKRCGRERKLS